MGKGRGLKEDGTWLRLQVSEKRDRPPPPTNDLSGELGQNDEDADDSFKIISPHKHIFSSETSSLKSEIPSVLF